MIWNKRYRPFRCSSSCKDGSDMCTAHTTQEIVEKKIWDARLAEQARREKREKFNEAKRQCDLEQKKCNEDAATVEEKKREFDILFASFKAHKLEPFSLHIDCKNAKDAQEKLVRYSRKLFVIMMHSSFAKGGCYADTAVEFKNRLMNFKEQCAIPPTPQPINPLCTCSYCVAALSR